MAHVDPRRQQTSGDSSRVSGKKSSRLAMRSLHVCSFLYKNVKKNVKQNFLFYIRARPFHFLVCVTCQAVLTSALALNLLSLISRTTYQRLEGEDGLCKEETSSSCLCKRATWGSSSWDAAWASDGAFYVCVKIFFDRRRPNLDERLTKRIEASRRLGSSPGSATGHVKQISCQTKFSLHVKQFALHPEFFLYM